MSMKVVIKCPKNILENELKKDFQISKFKLTGGTLYYITDIDENLFARCIGGVNGMLGLYIAIFGAFLIVIGIRNFLKLY